MSLIDDIKRDREAGTPGKWQHDGYNGVMASGSCDTVSCAVLGRVVTAEATGASFDDDGRGFYMRGDAYANAARIARVPDMEAALLAADEMVTWVKAALICQAWEWDADQREIAVQALEEYRKATQ